MPPCIAQRLRPHQREGVQFLAECVLGLRRFRGAGAILADDMGLGKTLQSVALLYTLLTQGFEVGKPTARRVLIVTPTSLVANWNNELKKWLDDRVKALAISESCKSDVVDAVSSFLSPRSTTSVLIISYDTFRLHCALFMKAGAACCDLLICDEAHRLKNSKTSTYGALDALPCRRRVLLSGTPLQNNLDEFYAMINFTNGGVLGDRRMFRRYYEQPILVGREPQADSEEQREGMERSAELSAIVNQFVLRRTNTLLSAHLPPKVMQVVCCRPTTLQVRLYDHLLKSKEVKRMVRSEDGATTKRSDVLPLINALRKLCNHPKLVYDEARGVVSPDDDAPIRPGSALARILRGCDRFFAESGFARLPSHPQWSGKMYVLERLLSTVRATTDDRVVIVSNYTSALDIIGELCTSCKWPFLRLDGATSIKKRQKLVDQLTDRRADVFCFLLSSRAGGCGLNLIGANRLVLFDPDWNPAVDKQAAARVWRDGQAKRCFIYRMLSTGTIEEKIYQRQLSKEGLADVLGGGMNEAACSTDELRELFHIRTAESASDTHDHLQCDCLDSLLTTEEEAARKKQLLLDQEQQQQQEASTTNSASPDDAEHAPSPLVAPVEDLTTTAPSPVPSNASDSEPPSEDDDDGFVVEDGDGEDDDDDAAPSKAKLKASSGRRGKKGKKARRSLKTSLVLDPLQLSSITKAMIGQRGCPPEEELINWGHHITGLSAPDPLFRQALATMKRTKEGAAYVSFVFSCEVKGKQIGPAMAAEADNDNDDGVEEVETAETKHFRQFSARCSLQPVVKEKTSGLVISADDALEKHRRMIEEVDRKRRKRLGLREDDDGDAAGGPGGGRRHSSRLTTRVNLSEDAMAAGQMEGEERRGKKRGNSGGVLDPVDESVIDEADAETAAAIRQLLAEEASVHSTRRKRGKKDDPSPQPQPSSREEEEEEDGEEEEEEDEESMIDVTVPSSVAATPASQLKDKAKAATALARIDTTDEEDEDEGEDEDDDRDDSSVELLAARKDKLVVGKAAERAPPSKASSKAPLPTKAAAPAKPAPALPRPRKFIEEPDDDDDFDI